MALRALTSAFGSLVLSDRSPALGNLLRRVTLDSCCGLYSRVLPNMDSKRSMAEFRQNRPRKHWITPEVDRFLDQRLTEENAEFLETVVKDAYKSPLAIAPAERVKWTPYTQRAGLLCKKMGTMRMWTKTGRRIVTTACQVLDNHVVSASTSEQFAKQFRGERYQNNSKRKKLGCLVVGAESIDPTNLTDEYCKLFEPSGLQPKRKLTKFVVTDDALLQPGTPLRASHFRVGDYVDVGGRTFDHGFQGVMKRWNFKGGPASHGATKFHRRPGSIGFSRHAGRVWKGKKMPGHMGNAWRITMGPQIMKINHKYDVIFVNGLIPGATNGWVYLWDTHIWRKKPLNKKGLPTPPPMPTHYPEEDETPLPEESYHPDIFQFDQPTIIFEVTEDDLKKARTGAKTALKSAPKAPAKPGVGAAAAKAGKA